MAHASLTSSGATRWRATLAWSIVLATMMVVATEKLSRSSAVAEAGYAYSGGDLTLCLQRALDHLERRPWSREGALWAARCLSRLDYAAQAETYFDRAGRLALSDLQIRAFGLARGAEPALAMLAFEEILARWPNNITALRRLAAVKLAQSGNTDELLELADRLCKIPRGAIIGETLRGVIYHNNNNPQRAAACFERVLEMDPQLHDMPLSYRLFWTHFADDLLACGRVDDAAQRLKRALALSADAALVSRLGRIYFLQGALRDAEVCFQQATAWDPTDHGPHLDLSKVALQRHHLHEALNHLLRANAISPQDFSVLYSLASVYRQLGRQLDAASVQQTITQLRDNQPGNSAPTKGRWSTYSL
jgi:tetratricopeptide (TPR) repeat protein